MHTRLPKHDRRKPHAMRSTSGAALIMVLTCLVLVTALAIGLLTRVQGDRAGATAYRGGATSRNLAEYAVNVVMAQITSATSGANAGNAWASQPGAIRTFNSSGNLVNIYKLYSSTNMVVSSFPTADTNLAGWSNNTALYTDLNAPVISSSGTTNTTNYPILNPNATNSVQGFSINSSAPTSSSQAAPMPVNWLYLLQDGTLVAPTNGLSNRVTVAGASSNNPITGRIAFWADDETCKININTASGMPWSWATANSNTGTIPQGSSYSAHGQSTTLFGNYWDTPIFGTAQDLNLVFSQPWQAEFQRFPGHPATVSLSAVFTNLSTNDIMQIAPRISYTSNGVAVGSQWGATLTISTGSTIPSDGARLYADPDELLYSTNRSATGTNNLTPEQISRGRFFLTAVSRAPDVTLFNTPRLVMWPITSSGGSTTKMTPYDQLIAFCGTVGGDTNIGGPNSYYFTRSEPYSTNLDYNVTRNQSLLTYLRNLTATAVPGYGNSSVGSGILGKYPYPEQIRTEIFDYIRCLNLQDNSVTNNAANYYSTNGLVVPTSGTDGTWGYGRMPVITKAGILFWYGTNNTGPAYRWVTNLVSTNLYPATMCARLVVEGFTVAHGYPEITDLSGFQITVSGLNNPTVLPVINSVTNNGVTNNVTNNVTNPVFTWGPTNGTTTPTNQLFSSDTATYMAPWLITANRAGIFQIGGVMPITMYQDGATNGPFMTSLTFSGGDLRRLSDGSNVITGPVTTGNEVWLYGPGFTNSTSAASCGYQGGTVTTNGLFAFRGGTVTISTSYRGTPLQTLSGITFPPTSGTMNLTYPTLNANSSYNGPAAWINTRATRSNAIFHHTINPIRSNDVILMTQLASGDFRMEPTVGSSSVPGTTWTNHPNYGRGITTNALGSITTNANYYAHTFMPSVFGIYGGARVLSNSYGIPSGTNFWQANSDRPYWPNGDLITNSTNGGTTLLTRFGDFDNGYGTYGDGPYIGFADEGAGATRIDSQAIPYYTWSSAGNVARLAGYFSPNRLVPSAGILGSLPTGVNPTSVAGSTPWQTLLFRPAALTAAGHPGLANPPDYLLLDLFNMPVVQPYAISEPLSTAGRINMNYQILPFTYIRRNTAVMAALHTEMLTACTNTAALLDRKVRGQSPLAPRYPLDLTTNNGTLAGFEQRFAAGDIFRSAAEICSIPLVPFGRGATYSGMTSWWAANNTYTGDNSKERPYARIYPKLTTKSNVFTVHYTVQVLKQVSPRSSASWTTWNEATDKVLATYRGATTIERYVNPRDTIKDYTSVTLPLNDANALPYKFRIIGERRFNP